jgi:hypothetical protein
MSWEIFLQIRLREDASADQAELMASTRQPAPLTEDPLMPVAATEESAADELADPIGLPAISRPNNEVAAPATMPATMDVDTDAARRRIKMQLYSRMMTDLQVLTEDRRLPTDGEIDDALDRAGSDGFV